MKTKPSEDSYLIQNILPELTDEYDFPKFNNETHTKIKSIPVVIGSKTIFPDVVYYYNEIPVFLLESKKENKSREKAVEQALSYIRNYPTSKYSKDNITPIYFAVTIGKEIYFYQRKFKIDGKFLQDWAEEIKPIHFKKILIEYGLERREKRVVLNGNNFNVDFFYELLNIYNKRNDNLITQSIIQTASEQIISYLKDGKNYVSRNPYVSLDKYKHKQKRLRDLFNKFDFIKSLGPDIAIAYRKAIIRAFQGGEFNQYLTEQCIIDFMVELLGLVSKSVKVIDFECGSGGFLASVINKYNLSLKNIKGIDIAELPYIVCKTYLALYFVLNRKNEIERIPVIKNNGLFNYGSDWNIAIGNPAGNKKYLHGNLNRINREGLKIITSSKRNCSEYELSIKQAIRSVKIEGKICLILTESFFSNTSDNRLRKYVAENCKINAIISLPRGIFKEGVSATQKRKGAKTATMKMSILFAERIRPISLSNEKIDLTKLDYPVFLASIKEPIRKFEQICEWLEPELMLVLNEWGKWNKQKKKSISKKLNQRIL